MRVLIIGCGFLGQKVAMNLRSQVSLTVTTTKEPPLIKDVKFIPLKPETYRKIDVIISNYDCIIVTASASKYNYTESYLILARRLKKALEQTKGKTLIYTSSSGVYKESSGGFVTENSPLDLDKASVLIETEKTYLSLKNTCVMIFRLTGLIGHDERSIKQLYSRYLSSPLTPRMANFIYVEDASMIISKAALHPKRGIYNLSSFTSLNTELFKKLFDKEPLIGTHGSNLHGGSKKVLCDKLKKAFS